ncbi:aldo/keto reductase, partial [Salmonella enterica subsp. enterica serovar Anatum]|nr:aldo/keto reductase [Salmonella enterica subsp. enterica serovar Anatum]
PHQALDRKNIREALHDSLTRLQTDYLDLYQVHWPQRPTNCFGAGVQAMQDSGLEVTEENASRIGAAIGSGIGGLGLIEENHSSL